MMLLKKHLKDVDRRIDDEMDMERVFYLYDHEQHIKKRDK